MSDLTPPSKASSQGRDSSEKWVFWLLWTLFLLPALAYGVIVLAGSVFSVTTIPVLIQFAILGVSLAWFLKAERPFSQVMWLLVGGSVLLYFLLLGSCVVLIFTA